MDLILVAAYFLPLLFLAGFIGHEGKKYLVYLLFGFLAYIPVLVLFPLITHALPGIPCPDLTISPPLEELFKALPIIISVVIGIRSSNRDLLVCAMASGIGFSIIETWTILSPMDLPLTLGNLLLVLSRSFSTSLMHGCTTGIIGYGLVLIRNFDRGLLPALLFGFYTLAVTTHAIYNILLSHYFGELGVIVDIIFPLLLFFFLRLCYHVDIPHLFRTMDTA